MNSSIVNTKRSFFCLCKSLVNRGPASTQAIVSRGSAHRQLAHRDGPWRAQEPGWGEDTGQKAVRTGGEQNRVSSCHRASQRDSSELDKAVKGRSLGAACSHLSPPRKSLPGKESALESDSGKVGRALVLSVSPQSTKLRGYMCKFLLL